MTATPGVSLVVLNWNGREHLDDCLGSLLALDYPSDLLELVFCDNGSEDGSVEYVRSRFPRFRVVELGHNRGFAEGNNLAAAAAQGEWVGFLNNDMVVRQGWLHAMVRPLQEQPGLACIASRISNWDGSAIDFIGGGINFQGYGLQLDHGAVTSQHDQPRRLLFACGGAMLVRRQLFLDVGGFDPSYFAFFEDVDLGWRLNLLGHDTWYTPEATVMHRHHGTANRLPAHQRKLLTERNALYTIYKNYDEENLARVLPVAILLMNEKALRMAGVDLADFRPETQAGPAAPAPMPPSQPPRPAATRRLVELLRAQGPAGVARKVRSRLRPRSIKPAPALTAGPPPGSRIFPDVAVSHLAAIGEFARNAERLRERRDWVQSRRVRTDAEVLAIGRVHMEDPTYGDADYIGFQHWLCAVLGLDAGFESVRL